MDWSILSNFKKSPQDMLRIEKSKPGRRDGGYTRIFNNEELGAELSRMHATSISSGNALEKLINHELKNSNDRYFSDFTNISDIRIESNLHGLISLNIRIMSEKGILTSNPLEVNKGSKKKYVKKQDFYIVNNDAKIIYLVELKEGDTFDTKKALGERRALDDGKIFFQKKFPDYHIKPMFVSFSSSNVDQIYNGIKKVMPFDWCFTGQYFCDMLNISYDEIMRSKREAAKENIIFFKNNILKIFSKM